MRKPVVAGSFYGGSQAGLQKQIENCFKHTLGPGTLPGAPKTGERHIIGLVSPHAGYQYSGPVASHGFLQLATELKPRTVVILGPNHSGMGAVVAISNEDSWQTPLGDVELDKDTGASIISASRWAEWDDLAHSQEHSIEVQLPFLQYVYKDGFKVIPIAMMGQNLEISQDLGNAIATALKDKNGIIIASSDFSHYEMRDSASKKDHIAIESILALNPEQLREVVNRYDISMCGPGPVMTMLFACKKLGANNARLLRYATSGDITGDSQVVGYASVAVTR